MAPAVAAAVAVVGTTQKANIVKKQSYSHVKVGMQVFRRMP